MLNEIQLKIALGFQRFTIGFYNFHLYDHSYAFNTSIPDSLPDDVKEYLVSILDRYNVFVECNANVFSFEKVTIYD